MASVFADGASAAVSREEIPLSEDQRAYLAKESSPGVLVRRALAIAAATPLVLLVWTLALTRVVSQIPVVGLLLKIYGILLTILAAVWGVIAIPFVFLVALPWTLLRRRAKLRADLASGRALRYSGSFPIKLSTVLSQLICDDAKFDVGRGDLKSIAPVLVDSSDEVVILQGAIERTMHCPMLLGVCDTTGRELFTVGSEGAHWNAVTAARG